MRKTVCIIAMIFAAQAPSAQTLPEESTPAAASTDHVSVRTGYRGFSVTLFGVNPDRRGRGDRVVVLRGPSAPATVWRYRRDGAIWRRSDPVRFAAAPTFFAIYTQRPLRQIAIPEDITKLGLDPFADLNAASAIRAGDIDFYRDGLRDVRAAEGLYQVDVRPNRREYDGGVFGETLQVPLTAPYGHYIADIYQFRAGHLMGAKHIPIEVERAGILKLVHDVSMGPPATVVLALFLLALGYWFILATLAKFSIGEPFILSQRTRR